jgi:RNA 2',3'-cyclic 3'-phosphodiesterase
MRLFIAIDPPQEILEYVQEVQDSLRKLNLFKGTFPKAENIHVTLSFLGEVDQAKIDELKAVLDTLPKGHFPITFGKLEVDNQLHPHTIWITLLSPELEYIMKQLSVHTRDQRPIKPHLTIARIKLIKEPKKLISIIQEMHLQKKSFLCKALILKRSQISSEGPFYTNIYTKYMH